MSEEIFSVPGVEVINDIPYAIGVEAIQRVFEYYGIKKSKKAAYKFTSKVGWKKRLKSKGKSLIAVPIPEIQRWIEKNYPTIWNSKGDNDEKRLIAKNFSAIESFEKIIDEIEQKLDNKENILTSDIPDIWKTEEETDSNGDSLKSAVKRQKKDILIKINECIDVLMNTPPSSLDSDTLSKIKDKLLGMLSFVDSICSISRCKDE